MSRCRCGGLLDGCPLCGGTGKPTCSLCGGTGYVAVEGDGDGEFVAVPCPAGCAKAERSRLPIGLPKGGQAWTFQAMMTQYPELLTVAKQLQGLLDAGHGWFVLHSPPGRGKSYLLCSMVNAALRRGYTAAFRDASNMLEELLDARWDRHPRKVVYTALVRELTAVDVLVLDEFGVHSDTEQRLSALREVVDARSDKGQWKITGFATNCEPGEILARYPWLASRFQHQECLEMPLSTVPNLRKGS